LRASAARRPGGAALVGVALLMAAACQAPAPYDVPSPTVDSEATRTRLALARAAADAGDLAEAWRRLEIAASAAPRSVAVRRTRARIARLRGDRATAEREIEAALALDPGEPRAVAERAALWADRGERERAVALLADAVVRRPGAEVHEQLLELTGLDPDPAPSPGLDDALDRLTRHPYDPAAHLRVAEAGLRDARRTAGPPPAWVEGRLRDALWLADLRPATAQRAFALWTSLDPGRADWRLVPVVVFADEGVRRDPAWRMRLRDLWRNASESLAPLLETRFVVRDLEPFRAGDAGDALSDLEAAFLATAPRLPSDGIIALFTTREAPRRPGARLGQAQLLGRRLLVRVAPRAEESRVLLHELLHLYGAVHVAPGEGSLMNPSGESLVVDAANAAIVARTRTRRFAAGGPDTSVFPYVDEEALAAAWVQWLERNLDLRESALAEARAESAISRYSGARLARGATALDPHLADVCDAVARILLRNRRYSEAARFFGFAARLHGADTPAGRAAAAESDRALRTGSRVHGIAP